MASPCRVKPRTRTEVTASGRNSNLTAIRAKHCTRRHPQQGTTRSTVILIRYIWVYIPTSGRQVRYTTLILAAVIPRTPRRHPEACHHRQRQRPRAALVKTAACLLPKARAHAVQWLEDRWRATQRPFQARPLRSNVYIGLFGPNLSAPLGIVTQGGCRAPTKGLERRLHAAKHGDRCGNDSTTAMPRSHPQNHTHRVTWSFAWQQPPNAPPPLLQLNAPSNTCKPHCAAPPAQAWPHHHMCLHLFGR